MDEFPDSIVAVMYHFNYGSYTHPYAAIRDNFYNVTYTPWMQIDGLQEGWPLPYRSKVLNRMAVPTDVTIDLSAVHVGDRTFDFTANVCLEAGGVDKTVRVYMLQLLDHYPPTRWYYRNAVQQHIDPDVDVALTAGNCELVTHQIVFDETLSWLNKWDTRVVVWAQEPLAFGPAEVYQAKQIDYPYIEQTPLYGNDFETGDFTGWARTSGG
jgi:hypothetical protein